jgi:hypothetical protein
VLPSFTAFDGHRRLASGPLREATLAVKRAVDAGAAGPLLVFDDATGRVVDVDTRGTEAEVLARLPGEPPSPADEEPDRGAEPRRRGRPRLGVVAREVTLLPRHWEWLAAQPGGASVALRRLVEEARRGGAEADRRRRTRDAAYRFMSAMAGDLPGFEEASRALFAGDAERFRALVAAWPEDVGNHVLAMALGRGGSGDE